MKLQRSIDSTPSPVPAQLARGFTSEQQVVINTAINYILMHPLVKLKQRQIFHVLLSRSVVVQEPKKIDITAAQHVTSISGNISWFEHCAVYSL